MAEVESILGKPKQRNVKGTIETWYYDVYSSDSFRTYPYVAIFESQALKSFNSDSYTRGLVGPIATGVNSEVFPKMMSREKTKV